MNNNNEIVLPIEKIISILSYLTMGIVGLIWLIIAYYIKKKPKYFLAYNIYQSIIISVFLAIFKLLIGLILSVIALIPFLDFIVALFNLIISLKIITLPIFHFSFSAFEFVVMLFICYIIAGVIQGKIFYIPKLTDLMQKLFDSHR